MKAMCSCGILITLLTTTSAGVGADTGLGVLPPDQTVAPAFDIASAPGGLRPGTDAFSLLTRLEVQQALGLSADQIDALRRSNPLFRNRVQDLIHSDDGGSQAALKRAIWTSRGAIANILDHAQIERLQQIMVQHGGPCMIPMEPELLRRLQVDDELRARITTECRALAAELTSLLSQLPASGDACRFLSANRGRLEALRRAGEAEVLSLFSAEQQEMLKDLGGPQLRLAMPPPAECLEQPLVTNRDNAKAEQ